MVNTIFILDKTKKTSKILTVNKQSRSVFWDDAYTQELASGVETFEFSTYADEKIVEGANVIFYYNQQYKMFTIMEIEEEHSEGQIITNCFCEVASLELITRYVRSFSGDMNCLQFFQYVLEGTGWGIGKYSSSLANNVQTINVSKADNAWSLIEDYKDIFECEINVRVTYENGKITGQYIDLYAEGELGTPTYKRFEYGRNVSGIVKSKNLYDWATGLVVDVEGVNEVVLSKANGDPFDKSVGDVILDEQSNLKYNGGRDYIMGVYQGKEEDPTLACLDAWKELQDRVVPKFDYEVTTALTDEEYENIHLGDTVYVIDHSFQPALLLEARVGKLELSFTDRTQNKCTLSNYKEVTSKLLSAEYVKLTGQISDIVNTFFPIGPDGIQDGAIIDGKIETTYYQQITSDIVSAGIGAFEELYAQGLTAINADIEELEATKATIGDLTATNGRIDNLVTNDLTSMNANIGSLQATVGNIQNLVNGNLSTENIHALNITSDKFTVEDGFIKNAMIDNVAANKITTGTIDTSKVNISSADGSMTLSGSLQQFKDDEGNVRIQIGKDAQGDFTFTLFDENGTGVLIDEKGITENAIADGLIVNDMVADNANISGDKLDINSVVTEINNGATTIKGSRIVLDENNQSLNIAFNSMQTQIDNMPPSSNNLLLESDAPKTSSEYFVGRHKTTKLLEVGKKYSFSMCITPAPGATFYQTYVNEGTSFLCYFPTNGAGKQVVTGTFTFNGYDASNTPNSSDHLQADVCLFRFPNDGSVTGESTLHWMTLVEGEKPLKEWIPAIEDIDSKIASNTTAINGLTVSGRNLFRNTEKFDDSSIWKGNSKVVFKDGDISYRKIYSSATSAWASYLGQSIDITPGEYVMSVLVRKNTTENPVLRWRYDSNDSYNIKDITIDSTSWKRYIFPVSTTNITSVQEFIALYTSAGSVANSESTSIDIAYIQFERANKATEWTPAPEDVYEEITSNTTAINVQQGQIDTLISNTTITKENGEVVQLKDEYSQFTQDLGGFKTEVQTMVTNVGDGASQQIVDAQEDILTKVGEEYSTKEDLNIMQESFSSSMEQTAQSMEMIFTETRAGIETVDGRISQYQEEVNQYIRFDAEGMELGEVNSNFTTRLDNEKLAFKDGDTEVAYISNKKMMITDAHINTSLQIGYFKFIPRSNGNLSIIWTDEVSSTELEEGSDE